MKIASALFAILGFAVPTIVTVWLLGSLVTWVAEEAGAAGQQVLVQLSTPWLGAKPHTEIRRLETVSVAVPRADSPTLTAARAPQ
jgi:hypothetical protein